MTYRLITFLIAAVWLVNGLYCKILNGIPRHRQIVARILGSHYAGELTVAIGVGELLIMAWVLSGIAPRWCAWVQIALVATMNIIEFFVVPDLLLFGRFNAVPAACFIGLIYAHAFIWRGPTAKTT